MGSGPTLGETAPTVSAPAPGLDPLTISRPVPGPVFAFGLVTLPNVQLELRSVALAWGASFRRASRPVHGVAAGAGEPSGRGSMTVTCPVRSLPCSCKKSAPSRGSCCPRRRWLWQRGRAQYGCLRGVETAALVVCRQAREPGRRSRAVCRGLLPRSRRLLREEQKPRPSRCLVGRRKRQYTPFGTRKVLSVAWDGKCPSLACRQLASA